MRVIVALGSNLGDRRGNLRGGLSLLSALGPVTASPLLLETPDESGLGPAYLNTVALVESFHEDPSRVLEILLQMELGLGRDRSAGRNAPRTLDLDLVAAEGAAGTFRRPAPPELAALGPELELVLPHPRWKGRAFVREPLQALQAELGDPWLASLLG